MCARFKTCNIFFLFMNFFCKINKCLSIKMKIILNKLYYVKLNILNLNLIFDQSFLTLLVNEINNKLIYTLLTFNKHAEKIICAKISFEYFQVFNPNGRVMKYSHVFCPLQ